MSREAFEERRTSWALQEEYREQSSLQAERHGLNRGGVVGKDV